MTSYTAIPAQPSLGEDPWYTTETAWKDAVEAALADIDDAAIAHAADGLVHVPSGGTLGQVLSVGGGGTRVWSTVAAGGATDHGALTGLSDPDHPISAVINLQTTLDGKSATGHTHSYDPTGTAAGLVAAHEAASDPHNQYLTPAEAAGLYAAIARGMPAGGASGTILGKTSGTDYAVGWVTSPAPAAPMSLVGTDPATVPLLVKAAAAQAQNILSTQLTDGTNVLSVTNTGEVRMGPGTTNTNGTLRIGILDPTRQGIHLRMAALQSAVALRVEDSAGVLLTSIDSLGWVNAPNIGTPLIVLSAVASVPGTTIDGTVILRRP